ncbi:MAG: LytTR family transcriptional regulator DNA-binding domain-containing protein [Bacteroidota bacterium]
MKTYQHIIFWIGIYVILTLIFADWFNGPREAFYYVSLLMPVVMGTSYFFNYFLVPRYLFKRKFLKFGLYSFYMLVISLCLELLVGIVSMLIIVYYGINENAPIMTDVFTLAVILYFIVLFKSFLLLIKHYFMDQRAISELEEKQSQIEKGYFTIRSNRQTSRVSFDELLYIESLADYIRIHRTSGGPIISKEKISHMESILPDHFVRIHRSYIVNTTKISSFSREHVLVGEKELPISRTYKKGVIESLGPA